MEWMGLGIHEGWIQSSNKKECSFPLPFETAWHTVTEAAVASRERRLLGTEEQSMEMIFTCTYFA